MSEKLISRQLGCQVISLLTDDSKVMCDRGNNMLGLCGKPCLYANNFLKECSQEYPAGILTEIVSLNSDEMVLREIDHKKVVFDIAQGKITDRRSFFTKLPEILSEL
jgi:hypothetical protein